MPRADAAGSWRRRRNPGRQAEIGSPARSPPRDDVIVPADLFMGVFFGLPATMTIVQHSAHQSNRADQGHRPLLADLPSSVRQSGDA
jgi:hypothetical protein